MVPGREERGDDMSHLDFLTMPKRLFDPGGVDSVERRERNNLDWRDSKSSRLVQHTPLRALVCDCSVAHGSARR